METDQEQIRLIMLQGPHPEEIFHLSEEDITLGREMQNNIVISDPEVSRKHARLRRTEGGYTIEDLGSTNGTFVNGARIARTVLLTDGDRVSLGETIQLVYQEQIPARDQTVVAGVGAVTPTLGESGMPAGPIADFELPAEPPLGANPPSSPKPIEPVEPHEADVLQPPPPFDEPMPAARAEQEPVGEKELALPPAPQLPFEIKDEARPVHPDRYQAKRETPSPPYEPSRPPAREPAPPLHSPEPPYRRSQRQESPPPPPYYEEYEGEPRPRSNRRRNLLIGCGCLLLLFACATMIGFAYLIWNAPYEFFQDPIRNFGRLFEILTMILVLS